MIAAAGEELICDFAETYHIFNYRALPVPTAAALAHGLREDSRVRMKLSGQRVPLGTLLSAAALDCLRFLQWAQTKDAQHRRNRPESIAAVLSKPPDDRRGGVWHGNSYDSGAAFDRAWKEAVCHGV